MTKLRGFLIASVMVSSVASAERDLPPRPATRGQMYKEGTAVFNREISPFFDDLTRQCVGDPSQKWMERMADIDAKIAKVSKPDDKRILVEYMAVLRPWVEDKIKQVPGVGSWADARAAVAAKLALAKVTPPPVGTSDAELKAMIAYAVKARAATGGKASKAISYAQNTIMGCEEFLGDPRALSDAHHVIDDNMVAYDAKLTAMARDVAQTRFAPFRAAIERMHDSSKAAGSWDAQVTLVGGAFEGVALAKDIVANEAMYLALGDFDSSEQGAAAAVADAKKHLAEYGPKIAAMLEDVSFPGNTKKDPARDKVTKKAVEGQAVVHGPLNWGGITKDALTEVENGVKYPLNRESGYAYYVVKPATWTAPVPEGIAPADLCEVHSQYLGRWTKGPPSYKSKLNKWNVANDRLVAPILCKNAKRVSKLK